MKHKFIILFGFMLFIGLVLFLPYYPVLCFQYENTKKLLAYYPIEQNERFGIRYTHSIHLTPVLESYYINDKNSIIQFELMYEDFAIGMPSNDDGDGRFIEKDGKYFITDMNRVYSHIDLRVGQVAANHTLIIGQNDEIPFTSFTKPGSWVRIQMQKINLWQIMKGGVDTLEYK
jgi:hypothetical protein